MYGTNKQCWNKIMFAFLASEAQVTRNARAVIRLEQRKLPEESSFPIIMIFQTSDHVTFIIGCSSARSNSSYLQLDRSAFCK